MNPTLLIRLAPGATDRAGWAELDHNGDVERRGHDALPALAERAEGRAVVVLVPTEEVLLTRVQIPTRSRHKLLQAIPFALEDQLVSDIDELHFAVASPGADGSCAVAVVEHARMRAWTDALTEAGLTATRLTPDALALPERADAWAGLVEDGRFVIRTGAGTGFAGEIDNLPVLLDAALAEAGPDAPQRLTLIGEAPAADASLAVEVEHDPTPADAVLARRAAAGALELRQGPYATNTSARARWRPWLPAAALLIAFVLIDTSRVMVERWQLEREADALNARVESIFRDVFPDAHRVVAPRARMETRLEQLRGGEIHGDGDLLDTLLAVGPHIRGNEGLRLGGLSWRGDTLELDMRVGSLQQLDRLKQTLDSENGFSAEIRQASSEDDEVQGRLIIRREAS